MINILSLCVLSPVDSVIIKVIMHAMLTDPAGETVYGSAEGATAPETLRHKGPQDLMALWKVDFL